jgi:hypothetical protein
MILPVFWFLLSDCAVRLESLTYGCNSSRWSVAAVGSPQSFQPRIA